jgi:hypothetical protein
MLVVRKVRVRDITDKVKTTGYPTGQASSEARLEKGLFDNCTLPLCAVIVPTPEGALISLRSLMVERVCTYRRRRTSK